jgi:hypothetical protein
MADRDIRSEGPRADPAPLLDCGIWQMSLGRHSHEALRLITCLQSQ